MNSSVYATLGILFTEHLQQHYYPSLLLVPDNRWEAHLPLRCLVVDDHRDGAEALGAFLTILGLDVRVVFSGRGAIELAQTFQPRMVVLDINMPGLDGFETAKRLKQQGWAGNAIFIAHTGMRREGTSGAVFEDFHHVLAKGDGSEAFEAIVDKLRVSD